MMNKKFKNLFSNTMIFAIGNVLTKFILFLLMPVYTIAMTTAEYYTGELIYNTVELVLPIATLCLYEAVFRFSIDKDVDHSQLLSSAFLLTLKIFTGITAIAVLVQYFIQYPYTWYFIFILFTWSLKNLFAQFVRGIGNSKLFVVNGVIHAVVLCICNVFFLLVLHEGIIGYLLSICIANVIAIIYLVVAAKVHRYIRFDKQDKACLKAMLIFALPMIPNTLSWWLVNLSGRYVLGLYLTASVGGLYTAASKVPAIMHLMSTVFQQAWQFSAAKEMNQEGGNDFFSDVFKIYSSFILLATSGLILCMPAIALLILQGEFYQGWVYVPLLLVAAALNCYSIYFGTFYTAAKKNKMVMVSTMIGATLNIVICVGTVPYIGVYGALLASCVAYFVIVMIRVIDTRKYAKIEIDCNITIFTIALLTVQAVIMSCFGMAAFGYNVAIFAIIFVANVIYYRGELKHLLQIVLSQVKP